LTVVYLQVAAGRGAAWRVPEVPGGADDAAGLRAADAPLRELPAQRDAELAALREQLAALHSRVAEPAARTR
jgi:hypothetical protein